MISKSTEIKRLVLLRLNPGDDILNSLRQAVKENDIKSGVIMNGLGSSSSYHYHVVADTNLPPKEAYPKAEGGYDIVCLSGLVIDGRIHAHILFSDDTKAQGGHLEEGTRVLTFNVIIIADIGDTELSDWDSIKAL